MGVIVQELLSTGLYKRSQGRIARQVTMGTLWVIVLIGAYRLKIWCNDSFSNTLVVFGLPFAVLLIGCWAAWRVINIPSFADFLISVEAEMNKVSWPTRSQLVRASIVVIVVMFFLAAMLFAYDAIFKWLLTTLRIVG